MGKYQNDVDKLNAGQLREALSIVFIAMSDLVRERKDFTISMPLIEITNPEEGKMKKVTKTKTAKATKPKKATKTTKPAKKVAASKKTKKGSK